MLWLRSECALKKQNNQILPEPEACHMTRFFYKITTLHEIKIGTS
jgi:hypothetical protein